MPKEEKYLVVEDGKNNLTTSELSLKYGIPKTAIRDWRRQYRENSGEIVSKPRNTKKKQYTGDFRLKVVKDAKENNLSYHKAGRKYDINKSVVDAWVKDKYKSIKDKNREDMGKIAPNLLERDIR